jgi:uncharacterized protein (TIGR01777 family)
MARVVVLTGAGGFLGRALVPALESSGYQVRRLVRRWPRAGEAHWDPEAGRLDGAALEGVSAAIHLAGEPIGRRWTPARKHRIRQSRLEGTRLLATTLAGLRSPPAVFLSASAIGIYGNGGDAQLTEETLPDPTVGDPGFLAGLAREWEAAADPARAAGIRVVHPRFGIVLAPDGGALARMVPAFRLGLGGPLGSGRQWMSWITRDDAVAAVLFLLHTPALAGPVNVVAPHPVRNAEFARALGTALNRPAVLPVPACLLSLLFGQLAREVLLAGQRVLPERLLRAGFRFRDPELLPALRRLLAAPA